MPHYCNQTNKEYSRFLWSEQIQHRWVKGSAWLLICLVSLSTFNQAQQPDLEAQLEGLAGTFQEDGNSGDRARLLAFCQRNTKSPQAVLGYFLLGYRDFQDGKFPEAKETLEQANRSATAIQDYVVFYLGEPPLGEGPVAILAELI